MKLPAGMPLTNRLDKMTTEQARWAIENGDRWIEYLRENDGEIIGVSKPPKKRKTWRVVKYKKPCRTCGQLIGFAETKNGNVMPVNLHDFTTHWGCEKPGKPKKKKGRK